MIVAVVMATKIMRNRIAIDLFPSSLGRNWSVVSGRDLFLA